LYRRCGFGAGWGQLQRALSDGPQRTVDKLLRPQADVEAFNRRCDESENAAAGSIEGLRAWWLRRMMETPHPLLEKMTLFWHGYFAVNATAVNNPQLMKEHVRLLRSHALGSFGSLLPAIARDPAMLVWLGADVNRKATRTTASSGPPGDVHIGTGPFRRGGCSRGGQSVHGPVRAAGTTP
jgi:hypothetical protein